MTGTNESWLSKNWLTVALIIAALILTWILFRGCAPDNTHVDEHKAVDSVNKYWQIKHKADSLYADSVAKADIKKDAAIANLTAKIKATEGRLTDAQQKASDLADIIQSQIDTAAKFKACDSLAVLVQSKDFQVHALTELTDSIINQYVKKLEVRQDVLTRLEKSYNDQNKALAETTQKYDGLYKDYNTSVKANKFNKTLSRILAGVVLVLGGALLIK